MTDKFKIEIDGSLKVMTWDDIHVAIKSGIDLTLNKKFRFTGSKDKHGTDIFEGYKVKLYNSAHLRNGFGKWVECEIVFNFGMFHLKWPDGYLNKYPLHPENYEVINK